MFVFVSADYITTFHRLCWTLARVCAANTPLQWLQRSGDARGDGLVVCPPTKFSIEQWRMVVIVTGYTQFVTSQYDVIFTFANQRFDEVC